MKTRIVLILILASVASGCFVSSKSSVIFHTETCKYALTILPENRIVFQTYADAYKSGRLPDVWCKPRPTDVNSIAGLELAIRTTTNESYLLDRKLGDLWLQYMAKKPILDVNYPTVIRDIDGHPMDISDMGCYEYRINTSEWDVGRYIVCNLLKTDGNGDFNRDGICDFNDYDILASWWKYRKDSL